MSSAEMNNCPFCGGAGVVSYWSDFLNFEDRRFCQRCETGGALAARLAEIVDRLSAEEDGHIASRTQAFGALR